MTLKHDLRPNLRPTKDPLTKWRKLIKENPTLSLVALEQYKATTLGFSPSVPELGWMVFAIKSGRVLAPPPV